MMELFTFNLLQWTFMSITFLCVFLGLLIQYFEDSLPVIIPQLYRYGKFSYSGDAGHGLLRVPKRWFKHFYIFSSIFSTFMLYHVISAYFLLEPVPDYIMDFLDIFGGNDRKPRISASAVVISAILLTMQCWKRLYETQCVSVYSDVLMDIGHYLLGFIHYFGAIVTIVLEAPGFTRTTGKYGIKIDIEELDNLTVFNIIAFLLCWYKQYESARILGDLRRNRKGNVVTSKHLIPRGGLFELVSNPHISCEIMMYVCLNIILFGNTTWPFILFWVASNQTSVALLNHQWYVSKFPDYPKNRKALIPWVF